MKYKPKQKASRDDDTEAGGDASENRSEGENEQRSKQ